MPSSGRPKARQMENRVILEAAFEAVYLRLIETRCILAIRYNVEPEDIEDAIHDVMASIWFRQPSLQKASLRIYADKGVKWAAQHRRTLRRRNTDSMPASFMVSGIPDGFRV